jgi:MFS family permease
VSVVTSPALSIARDRRPLISLLTADGISQTGNMLTLLAIPWFVLATTGSAARTGLTASMEALAFVVAGLLGGPLVDRIGHLRSSVVCDLGSALCIGAIPACYHTVGLTFWQLLLLVFIGGLFAMPGTSARRSLYASVASRAQVNLTRTNTASATINRVAGLLGPLVAGVLIAATGPADVLWIDAASFLISAVLVLIGVASAVAPKPSTATASESSYLRETLDGLRFIHADKAISALVLVIALGSMLAEPVYAVIFPVYARETTGKATSLGVVFAGLAAGSLIGNGISFAILPRLPRRGTIIAGFALRALAFCVLVSMPSIPVVAILIAIAAIAFEPINPVSQTVFQERVPERMRGRVFGAYFALAFALRAVGVAGYGLLLEHSSLQTTLLVLAITNLILPMVLWQARGLRHIQPQPSSMQSA